MGDAERTESQPQESSTQMKRSGRLSRRDRLAASNAWSRFYAGASERPDAVERTERDLITPLPPKRERVRRPVDGKPPIPLEKQVLAAILQALRLDKRVGFVWRQSSGTFQEGERFIKAGPVGMPDILGVLVGGRMLAIEVKRPGQKPDDRQAHRLMQLTECGALAGWADSVESALALLP